MARNARRRGEPGKALDLVREAAPDKPDLILFPENGLMIGTNDEMRAAALAIDSPEIDQLRSSAGNVSATVILGGFKRRADDGSVHNTALVIGPSGEIVGGYDKIHLFDATIGGQKFQASRVEVAGTEPVIAVIKHVNVAVTICSTCAFPNCIGPWRAPAPRYFCTCCLYIQNRRGALGSAAARSSDLRTLPTSWVPPRFAGALATMLSKPGGMHSRSIHGSSAG